MLECCVKKHMKGIFFHGHLIRNGILNMILKYWFVNTDLKYALKDGIELYPAIILTMISPSIFHLALVRLLLVKILLQIWWCLFAVGFLWLVKYYHLSISVTPISDHNPLKFSEHNTMYVYKSFYNREKTQLLKMVLIVNDFFHIFLQSIKQ